MITKKADGEQKRFILTYNRSELDPNNIKDAIELSPTELYWKGKLPLEEVADHWDEEAGGWKVFPDFLDDIDHLGSKWTVDEINALSEKLSGKYWITRTNYDRFKAVFEELKIDEKHWSDLMLIGNYLPKEWEDYLTDRNTLSKEIRKLNTLVECFGHPLFELDIITVKGSFPERRKDENLEPVTIRLSEPGINHNLSRMFKDWVTGNLEFQNILQSLNDRFEKEGRTHSVYRRMTRSKVIIYLYDFIADKKISSNHQNACFMIGKILSHYDFTPTLDHYEKHAKKSGSFKDYDQYLSNHMRTTVERILKEKRRTKRFKI